MNIKSNKGFTLIEIILSLAIFAIISVGFLGMFSTVFINTYRTTEVTENTFQSQKEIEEEIIRVKNQLTQGITPTGVTASTVSVFSGSSEREVTVYHLKISTAGSTVESMVSETRAPQLRVPVITSGVHIRYFSGATALAYPNIGHSNLKADLSTELQVDNPGLLIRYLYYWYISKPGQYVPARPPVFPDDYILITDQTTRLITNIPESYAGRFLKLVVTPVGERGQMGTSVESNEIYLSPFKTNANLLLHFNASYVDIGSADTTLIGASEFLTTWRDIGSLAITATQATNNRKPKLEFTFVDESETQEIISLTGELNGQVQSLTSVTHSSLNGLNDITVYFVAKFDDSFPNNTVIFRSRAGNNQGNRWLLQTNSEGRLQIVRYFNSATSLASTVTDVNYRSNEWTIFKLEIWNNSLRFEVNNVSTGAVTYSTNTNTMMTTPLLMNFHPLMSIGEILIFNGRHADGAEDEMDVYDYLSNKYMLE